MTEIRFYHLQRQSELQVLPVMLQTALSRGQKAVLKFAAQGALEAANDYLWTYDPNSFLPHGSAKEGHAEQQPVWLTLKDENPNKADILFLCGGAESEIQEQFILCCEMLDDANPEGVAAARSRWKLYQDKGYDVTYWKQTERGGWEKK